MKFLAVTDLHYSDKSPSGNTRRHELSLNKLKKAISEHISDAECVMCLGDMSDSFRGWMPQQDGLKQLVSELEKSGKPFHILIGNHDTAMDKHDFCRIARMSNRYYAFDSSDCRCIVLDTCMNSKTQPYPPHEIEWEKCWVDDEQLEWLENELKSTEKPAVVFTHTLLATDGDERTEGHILLNADEVNDILIGSGKVAAVFSGHYHFGLHTHIGNIPYVVFSAMCDDEEITCAEVEVSGGKVRVKGYGYQKSIEM